MVGRTRGTVTIGAVAALALTGAGLAGAAVARSGPVSPVGVITGCYTNAEIHGSHRFVLQDSGTRCPKRTTAVSLGTGTDAGIVTAGTCTLSDLSGPDAANLSATPVAADGGGCDLSGLPSDAVLVATQSSPEPNAGVFFTVTDEGGGEWQFNPICSGSPCTMTFVASPAS